MRAGMDEWKQRKKKRGFSTKKQSRWNGKRERVGRKDEIFYIGYIVNNRYRINF